MGRKKLNRSKKELLVMQKERSKRYYIKHKIEINSKIMLKYYENKKIKNGALK